MNNQINSHLAYAQNNHADILVYGIDVTELPCNLDGGSPFLFTDYSRVTGPIFTGPHCLYRRHCGMTSTKSMGDGRDVRRRVDRPSTKNSTKGIAVTLIPSFLHHLSMPLFSTQKALSIISLLPFNLPLSGALSHVR